MVSRYLTKSRFKLAVECPRKLWYTGKPEYRNIKSDDTFLKSLADGGFQVGELAKTIYSNGIEVYAKDNETALRDTSRLLENDEVTLFEAAISYGGLLVRIDVLVKNGSTFKIIEVKSKSYRSDDPQFEGRSGLKSGFKPYIEDIAFQDYVLRSAYPGSQVSSHLLMPDKSRSSTVDKMNQLFKVERTDSGVKVVADPRACTLTSDQSLLCEVNVDRYIDVVRTRGLTFPGGTGSLSEQAALWADAYAADRALHPPIGAQCAGCEFKARPGDTLKSGFDECWKEANGWSDRELAEPTLLDLWNFRGKQRLMDMGARKLSDLTQEDIKFTPGDHGLSTSERQWLQIEGLTGSHKAKGFYIDRDFMTREIETWRFPLHFIDFETSTSAMPFHVGMRPYESVAFQFSHHIMESDGSLRHANQFLLSQAGRFPNFEFVRALSDALSNDAGSVFMWSCHENTILKHIAEQLASRDDAPEDKDRLIEFLNSLTKGGSRAMIDLKLVAQNGYFHPSTKGSNSIKKVLPSVLMSSTFLRDRYSQPIYGAKDGIESKNFRDIVWWSQGENGVVCDPYKKLVDDALTAQEIELIDDDDLDVAAGGEASMAYGRLQFETLSEDTRASIEAKLLRYCELDTLAMAMVVECWRAAISESG